MFIPSFQILQFYLLNSDFILPDAPVPAPQELVKANAGKHLPDAYRTWELQVSKQFRFSLRDLSIIRHIIVQYTTNDSD